METSSANMLLTRRVLKLTGSTPDGVRYDVYLRETLDRLAYEVNATYKEVYSELIFTRAWCFQEHLLAPRMLHFTAKEIISSCNITILYDCSRWSRFARQLPPLLHRSDLPPAQAHNANMWGAATMLPARSLSVQWWQTVEAYTKRHNGRL
jgi:hypothetical protein